MPTRKQEKQLKRQENEDRRYARSVEPDPREEKPIVKHNNWVKR